MPWYKLKWKNVYRVTSLRIKTSSNEYFRDQMRNFQIKFLKKGEEVRVYSEDGEPANGWHQINGVFPLDFDELKIELSTVNLEDYTYPEDRNPVLAIEGIEVKGNLSVESLMESFQYNPPALPFSGKVKCNDDIEKMAFQALVCDIPNTIESSEIPSTVKPYFYFQGTSKHWWFPHLLVTPSTFQDQIEAFLKSQYTDNEDLVNWMKSSKRYGKEDWTKLAEELGFEYRKKFSTQMDSLSSFTKHQKSTECTPKVYPYETAKYFCLDSSAENIGTTFTYTSSAATEGSKYKLLSEDVRDQDNFGLVAVGDIAAATSSADMSPIFIKPGDDNSKSISFKKGCYNAFIELVDFDSKTSVPSVDGMGKLPDKCTRTGVCVVHWCGSEKIVLSATTRKSQTKFKISTYIGGQKTAMHGTSLNTEYCLQQAQQTSSSCKRSRSFTVPVSAFEAANIPSTNAKRGSIMIEKRADTTKTLECFDLPYNWNFDEFQNRMTGNSQVSSYYTPQFEVPANIVNQTQLQLVDVANDIGGALAVYYTHDDTQKVIKAQVCTSENKSVELPFEVNMSEAFGSPVTKTAAISDSGTVVVIEDGGELKIFNLNAVKDIWENIDVATITDVPGTIIQAALSTHGHFLAVLFKKNEQKKALLYQKDKLGLTYSRSESPLLIDNPSADQVSVYASESGLVSLAVRSKQSNTILQTMEVS